MQDPAQLHTEAAGWAAQHKRERTLVQKGSQDIADGLLSLDKLLGMTWAM